MDEELSFGKYNSKFVIRQNISIDDLVEGIPIEREYDIILYNMAAPTHDFPELGFFL